MSLAELLVQALALFDHMDGMGIQRDVITCTILINGLLRATQLNPAFQVFFSLVHDIGANTISNTGMDGMGIQRDVITCTILINGLLRATRLNPAFQVFFSLVHDIGANTISNTGIMDALTKANEVSKDLVKLITYLKN
ncbi:hypothetical protein GOP47_0021421 [Adiantum capillus-veneris]|uniref:Uncharacterized protein n=1 Tax=Adiantum capillus-veneris TaxID=13818 RepID=A0A9D4Z688_ADICA|nr:hypothetical protein GOP47_0021421 [Adiantum capillus-veneris]